jgi:hypothetical protein
MTDKAKAYVKVDPAGTRVSTMAALSEHYSGSRSRNDAEGSIDVERHKLLGDPGADRLKEIARYADDQGRGTKLCSASHRPQRLAATRTVEDNIHLSAPV